MPLDATINKGLPQFERWVTVKSLRSMDWSCSVVETLELVDLYPIDSWHADAVSCTLDGSRVATIKVGRCVLDREVLKRHLVELLERLCAELGGARVLLGVTGSTEASGVTMHHLRCTLSS